MRTFGSASEPTPDRAPSSWVASVGQALTTIRTAGPEPTDVLEALVGAAATLLDAPAAVSLLEGDLLVRRAVAGAARLPVGVEVALDGTVCGRALQDALPVRGRTGPRQRFDLRCCPGAQAVLAQPLIVGERVIGVLAVLAELPEWFDDVDESALALLAGAAASMLDDSLATDDRKAFVTDDRSVLVEAGRHPRAPRSGATRSDANRSDDTPLTWVLDTARPERSERPALAPPGPPATSPALPSLSPSGGSRAAVPAVGLWRWSAADGRIDAAGDLLTLLDHPADRSLTLEAVRRRVHPDDRPSFEATVRRQVEDHEAVHGTYRLLTRDGQERHLYACSDVEVSPRSGTIVSAWGVVLDVGERVRGQDDRRSLLTAVRAARALTGLAGWRWDPDSGALTWTDEVFTLVGLVPGSITPTLAHWHHFVHPDDLPRARRLDVDLARTAGGPSVGPGGDGRAGVAETFRVVRADGTVRHVQAWAVLEDDDPHRPVVTGALVDVTDQVADRDLVERLSTTDPVTGLGNRLAFDRRVNELLSDASRDVALLLLDVDRFKTINDSLGHQVGDRLLVEVANRLASVVPPGALTARMGGDEFVVVPAPGMGWLQVRHLAESVVEAMRTPYLLPDSGEMLVCPVSLGVTATSGREVSAHDLLSEADLALYQAKDLGRDRYVVFDDALRARVHTRHRAERTLRSALEDGRLVLHYQPVVDLDDDHVVGAEALVRLLSPDGSRLLLPEAFIDVAEDTGLVVELDCWVIDTALQQLARWYELRRPDRPASWLALNVSARSMEHPRVVRRLLGGLEHLGLPPELLKVELTEHTFLGARPGAETALRDLLAAGVPVGIDDFGTGYSALAYLQRFDLDFMKIDRSFVARVGEEERADAVVTAIVDLAHAHGMQVTAEGVENTRQAVRLREIGCDFAQGYHFGAPGDPRDAMVF